MTSVWGVSAVAMLDSSVNCVCVWSTKKLTMPAYCVATNCNNSQTTPGITMHELPRNRPAVRRKLIKFIQFKRADFLAAPHHAHLCSEHFSECDFANTMEYRMSKLTRCSSTLSKSCLTFQNVLSIKSLVCVSMLQMVLVLLTSLNCCMSTLRLVHYTLLLTPACWKSNNTNARLMVSAPSLALDPTFGSHSHKTLDTAQPCHLLKPN